MPDLFVANSHFTIKSKDFERWLKSGMRDLILLVVHVMTTVLRLVQPGGVRAVIAESVLVKRQLLILNRSAATCAQFPHCGSSDRRIVFALD